MAFQKSNFTGEISKQSGESRSLWEHFEVKIHWWSIQPIFKCCPCGHRNVHRCGHWWNMSIVVTAEPATLNKASGQSSRPPAQSVKASPQIVGEAPMWKCCILMTWFNGQSTGMVLTMIYRGFQKMFHHPNPIFVLACQEKESVFWVWKLPEQVQDLFIKCWQPWNRDLRHPRKRARCSSLALKTCQIDAAVQIGVHLELHVCPFGNFSERVGPSSRQFSSDAHTTTLWSWMTGTGNWKITIFENGKSLNIIEMMPWYAMICHGMALS